MINVRTMDDFDFKNKTVILRVDFNSPLDPKTKEITDDSRIKAHVPTIKELIDKGAKVVIITHQGRLGDPDFSTTQPHAKILSNILKKNVQYVDDIFGDKAQTAIKNLQPGEVLLLENVRMWPEETAKKSPAEFAKSSLVRNLAPLADVYIDDGFAVAHRGNGSIVGFPEVMPAIAGRIIERELTALIRVKEAKEKPCIYILGGAKAEDAASISEYVLTNNKADYVLTGGVIGQLFLYATGVNIGDLNIRYLEERSFTQHIPKIKELCDKFPDRIWMPEDVGISIEGKRKNITRKNLPTSYPILDIGPKTTKKYADLIKRGKIIVVSGPMGVYEQNEFLAGTRGVLEAIAKSAAFSVAGGGNTIEVIDKLGLSNRISYISTGGGALMEFLTGKTLPGIEALINAAKRAQT